MYKKTKYQKVAYKLVELQTKPVIANKVRKQIICNLPFFTGKNSKAMGM